MNPRTVTRRTRCKVALILNFCPHYRVQTFELISRDVQADFFFYSSGQEWYWQKAHGTRQGAFRSRQLRALSLGGVQITPTLLPALLHSRYDVFLSGITGRFTLSTTYLASRISGRPFILWTGIWMRLQTRAHRLLFPAVRYIYRHADAIVVYGEHVKRYLISEGVSAERIFVAAHAVENELYQRDVSPSEQAELRQKLTIATNDRVVLYLGRIEEVKGLGYLLEAFASAAPPDAVLILAGTGSALPGLQEYAERLGILERVRFPGYVKTDSTMAYYAIASVFVLPSITMPTGKETWGLVVNEAMNQGVPVIATDAVGAAAGGLVQDGVNGFVVPERDSAALGEALRRLIDDEDLRRRMGENARRIVAEWDNERMVQGFLQAIEYVTRPKSHQASGQTSG